jgi:hypothetical protein
LKSWQTNVRLAEILLLASVFDPQGAYWLLLPCYATIFRYAGWGRRLRRWGGAGR